jgi:hypothetical protein
MAIPPDAFEAIIVLTLPVTATMMYGIPRGTVLPTRALPPQCSRS